MLRSSPMGHHCVGRPIELRVEDIKKGNSKPTLIQVNESQHEYRNDYS